jgi:hypothetical protein
MHAFTDAASPEAREPRARRKKLEELADLAEEQKPTSTEAVVQI